MGKSALLIYLEHLSDFWMLMVSRHVQLPILYFDVNRGDENGRFQRGDRGIQEHQLHRVGRGRSG